MSESDQTPQSEPLKEGGLKQPDPRPPADQGLSKTGGTKTRGEGRQDGVGLGELRLVSDANKDELRGAIVVCPPSALNDRWSRRLPDPITAMASGWMRVRQRARQRMVELPLVISDHADWGELTRTIEEVNPAESWITHGREEALARWAELHGVPARALALVGYEEELED